MKTLKKILTFLAFVACSVFLSYTLKADTVTPTTTTDPIYWLDLSWQILTLIGFGIVEVIARFFSKYRGIIGTVIKILTWIEDHSNRNVTKISR